jgi:hypothetical protein
LEPELNSLAKSHSDQWKHWIRCTHPCRLADTCSSGQRSLGLHERRRRQHSPPGAAFTGTVPLQEEEVIQAIRLLTRFGEVSRDESKQPLLQVELGETDPNSKLNLQQLLESLAANMSRKETDTPLLMKAAEHMAIRFVL